MGFYAWPKTGLCLTGESETHRPVSILWLLIGWHSICRTSPEEHGELCRANIFYYVLLYTLKKTNITIMTSTAYMTSYLLV